MGALTVELNFYMLDRFLILLDFINLVILDIRKEKSSRSPPPQILQTEKVDLLIIARDLLRPLEEATNFVSQQK